MYEIEEKRQEENVLVLPEQQFKAFLCLGLEKKQQ
jgi:hypothetical protein